VTIKRNKPILTLLLYRLSPNGKLASLETVDFERLGSFSFLLALFFFFHKKKKKAEPMDSADEKEETDKLILEVEAPRVKLNE
jgi:hypothetical protein